MCSVALAWRGSLWIITGGVFGCYNFCVYLWPNREEVVLCASPRAAYCDVMHGVLPSTHSSYSDTNHHLTVLLFTLHHYVV